MFDLINCCQQKIISGYFILEMSAVAVYSWRALPSGQSDTDASLLRASILRREWHGASASRQAARLASSLAQPAISVICTVK